MVAGTDAKETSKGLSEEGSNRIGELIRDNRLSIRDIASLIAEEEGLAYRQVYKECLVRKRIRDGCEKDGSDTDA